MLIIGSSEEKYFHFGCRIVFHDYLVSKGLYILSYVNNKQWETPENEVNGKNYFLCDYSLHISQNYASIWFLKLTKYETNS